MVTKKKERLKLLKQYPEEYILPDFVNLLNPFNKLKLKYAQLRSPFKSRIVNKSLILTRQKYNTALVNTYNILTKPINMIIYSFIVQKWQNIFVE